MGSKCALFDLKCALKNTPLGPVAKALDKPLQAATGIAAQALKGTPLGNVVKAINQVNTGNYKAAGSTAFVGIMDVAKAYVPALGSVPGIGLATDAVAGLIDGAINPKKAGGASLAGAVAAAAGGIAGSAGIPIPNLSSIVGPNSPLGPLLQTKDSTPPQPTPPRLPPTASNIQTDPRRLDGAQTVVQNAAAIVALPPQVVVNGKRLPRKFTPEQFRAFAGDRRTVGGTQPWAVE